MSGEELPFTTDVTEYNEWYTPKIGADIDIWGLFINANIERFDNQIPAFGPLNQRPNAADMPAGSFHWYIATDTNPISIHYFNGTTWQVIWNGDAETLDGEDGLWYASRFRNETIHGSWNIRSLLTMNASTLWTPGNRPRLQFDVTSTASNATNALLEFADRNNTRRGYFGWRSSGGALGQRIHFTNENTNAEFDIAADLHTNVGLNVAGATTLGSTLDVAGTVNVGTDTQIYQEPSLSGTGTDSVLRNAQGSFNQEIRTLDGSDPALSGIVARYSADAGATWTEALKTQGSNVSVPNGTLTIGGDLLLRGSSKMITLGRAGDAGPHSIRFGTQDPNEVYELVYRTSPQTLAIEPTSVSNPTFSVHAPTGNLTSDGSITAAGTLDVSGLTTIGGRLHVTSGDVSFGNDTLNIEHLDTNNDSGPSWSGKDALQFYGDGNINKMTLRAGHFHSVEGSAVGGDLDVAGSVRAGSTGTATGYVSRDLTNDATFGEPQIILLGRSSIGAVDNYFANIVGRIRGYPGKSDHRGRLNLEFTASTGSDSFGPFLNLQSQSANSEIDIEPVTCTYNTSTYVGIRLYGSAANWYPANYRFVGDIDENEPASGGEVLRVVPETAVTNVSSFTASRLPRTRNFNDHTSFSGDVSVGDALDVTGAATVGSTLDVTGATTVSDSLAATGRTSAQLQMSNEGAVGTTTPADWWWQVRAAGEFQLRRNYPNAHSLIMQVAPDFTGDGIHLTSGNTIALKKSTTVSGALDITGSQTVGGNQHVTGTGRFDGVLDVNANVHIGNFITHNVRADHGEIFLNDVDGTNYAQLQFRENNSIAWRFANHAGSQKLNIRDRNNLAVFLANHGGGIEIPNGPLTVANAASVGTTLDVGGATTIGGTLGVTGGVTFPSATINGTFADGDDIIDMNLWRSFALRRRGVNDSDADLSLEMDAASNNFKITNNVAGINETVAHFTTNSDVRIPSGDLIVSGATTLDSLGVTGAATVGSTLDVAGTTTHASASRWQPGARPVLRFDPAATSVNENALFEFRTSDTDARRAFFGWINGNSELYLTGDNGSTSFATGAGYARASHDFNVGGSATVGGTLSVTGNITEGGDDVVSSSTGDYDIQKNGVDGVGIINFKTA